MDFISLVGEAYFSAKNVTGLLSKEWYFKIESFNVSIEMVSAPFSVMKEIKQIGEIENFSNIQFDFADVSIENGILTENVKGITSYASFFEILHKPKLYTHLHDIKGFCKLIQNKHIVVKNAPMEDLGVVPPLEDVFFKRDLSLVRHGAIGRINIAKKDSRITINNAFTQIAIYSLQDFTYDVGLIPRWGAFKLEGLKNNKLFWQELHIEIRGSYNKLAPVPKKFAFEDGVKNIEGDMFGIDLVITEKFVGGLSGVGHFNLALSKDTGDSMYGVYSLSKLYTNIGGLLVGTIQVAMFNLDAKEYVEIVDIVDNNYSLFDYRYNKEMFVNIYGNITLLGDYIGTKDVSIESVSAKFYMSTPEKEDLIEGFVADCCDALMTNKKEIMDVESTIYRLTVITPYTGFKINKEGNYREILFNKKATFNINNEHIPHYTFTDLKLSDWKDFPINVNELETSSYLVEDYKRKSLFKELDALSVIDFKGYFGLKYIDDILSVKNPNKELWMYNEFGKQMGNVSGKDSLVPLREALQYFYVYLTKEYKQNAYILYTQQNGTYMWTPETLNKALDFMHSDNIVKSNNYITDHNLYPYGILRIYNYNSAKMANEYIGLINGENSFTYEDVIVLLDTSSIDPINKIERLKNTEIGKTTDSKVVFHNIDFQSYNVEGSVLNDFLGGIRVSKSGSTQMGFYKLSNTAIPLIGENTLTQTKKHINTKIFEIEPVKHVPPKQKIPNGVFTIESSVTYFVSLSIPEAITGMQLEMELTYNPLRILSAPKVESSFKLLNFNILNNVEYLGSFEYLTKQKVKGDMFEVCNFRIKHIRGILSAIKNNDSFNFTINKGLQNIKGFRQEWSSVWLRTYVPIKSNISILVSKLYELTYQEVDFDIHMPIDYLYVDDSLGKTEKAIPKKGLGIPALATNKVYRPTMEISSSKNVVESKKPCKSPYNRLTRDGFEFNIEANDNILLGNNVFEIKSNLYGGDLTIKSSVFASNRYASDLDALKNNMIDVLEAKVKAPVDDNYDISSFTLTKDDFGAGISDESFNQIQTQMDGSKAEALKGKDIANQTLSQYMSTHPDSKKEIKEYMDNLNSPEDSFVWEHNPARTPIDGILFKKKVVKQELSINYRKDE